MGRDGRRWRGASRLGPAHRAEDGGEARYWRQEKQEGEEKEGGRERRGEGKEEKKEKETRRRKVGGWAGRAEAGRD